jgi:monoamine oxidase
MPYSEAAWMVWPRYGNEFARLQEPVGRWWFAGDWLTRDAGWLHGAITSARAAVTSVHTTVLNR